MSLRFQWLFSELYYKNLLVVASGSAQIRKIGQLFQTPTDVSTSAGSSNYCKAKPIAKALDQFIEHFYNAGLLFQRQCYCLFNPFLMITALVCDLKHLASLARSYY